MPDPQARTTVDVKVQGCDALAWADAGGVYFAMHVCVAAPLVGLLCTSARVMSCVRPICGAVFTQH